MIGSFSNEVLVIKQKTRNVVLKFNKNAIKFS